MLLFEIRLETKDSTEGTQQSIESVVVKRFPTNNKLALDRVIVNANCLRDNELKTFVREASVSEAAAKELTTIV